MARTCSDRPFHAGGPPRWRPEYANNENEANAEIRGQGRYRNRVNFVSENVASNCETENKDKTSATEYCTEHFVKFTYVNVLM